jgi:hypothetical protein
MTSMLKKAGPTGTAGANEQFDMRACCTPLFEQAGVPLTTWLQQSRAW